MILLACTFASYFFWFVSENKDLGFLFVKKETYWWERLEKIVIFQAEICWVFLLLGLVVTSFEELKEKAGILYTL